MQTSIRMLTDFDSMLPLLRTQRGLVLLSLHISAFDLYKYNFISDS